MLNGDVIKERMEEMSENLRILVELQEIGKEKFKADPKVFKLTEHCLQISIQALLDICHYIIANNNWPRPKDNQEAISIIARYKVIPEDFSKRIKPMAGLRNILIHEYLKVDLERIYRHLQHLDDFHQFQKYILAYLKKIASR
jgi:uncharacterized protein YutE (UPF0331/DUF86 family)